MLESLKIILLCTAGAIVFGIGIALYTVQVSPEHFTVTHRPVFGGTRSPLLLAFFWGMMGTWWLGGLVGAAWSAVATKGEAPRMTWRELRRPLVLVFVLTACAAAAAAIFPGQSLNMALVETYPQMRASFPSELSDDQLRQVFHVEWIHSVAYAVGGLLNILVWFWILMERAQRNASDQEMRRRARETALKVQGESGGGP